MILEKTSQIEFNRERQNKKGPVYFSAQVIRVCLLRALTHRSKVTAEYSAMSRIIGPLSNSVDQQVDELMAGLGEGSHHSGEAQRTSEQVGPQIIGPLSNSIEQQVDEVMAGLGGGSNSNHSDEDESFETFRGGVDQGGGGHALMNPKKFLKRPRAAYTVTVGNCRVKIDIAKRCFYIHDSPHQSQVARTRLTAAVASPSVSVTAAPLKKKRG